MPELSKHLVQASNVGTVGFDLHLRLILIFYQYHAAVPNEKKDSKWLLPMAVENGFIFIWHEITIFEPANNYVILQDGIAGFSFLVLCLFQVVKVSFPTREMKERKFGESFSAL